MKKREMILDGVVNSPEFLSNTEIKAGVLEKYGVTVSGGEVSKVAPQRLRIMAACSSTAILTARKLLSQVNDNGTVARKLVELVSAALPARQRQ